MATKKPPLLAGHYYHLFSRGVNRQVIFFAPENWLFFLDRMGRYFQQEYLDVLAYCLMPNHYHLLVYLRIDEVSRKVLQPFGTSYSKAINKQQGRVGPLFQGPFKAKLVDDDGYLAHLTRYIHLNPVEAGLAEGAADWPYSSYGEYVGMRKVALSRPELILQQFGSRGAYREFVEGEGETAGEGFLKRLSGYCEFD